MTAPLRTPMREPSSSGGDRNVQAVNELRALDREYRTHLQIYLISQIRKLDGRGTAAPAEMSPVVLSLKLFTDVAEEADRLGRRFTLHA